MGKISKKVPIYSPRTAYYKIRDNDEKLLQDLLIRLDPFTVQVLTNDFNVFGGEVNVIVTYFIYFTQNYQNFTFYLFILESPIYRNDEETSTRMADTFKT